MKIAIPMAQGQLCPHFGHCEQFAMLEVNEQTKEILSIEYVEAPPHQPGFLPPWMKERNVDLIIAGGMGARAIGLFEQLGIKVIVGASPDKPENIVQKYLNNTLTTGQNLCDH
ncbi:MAG TPA: ATPase [Desulfonauticus sp.]|nr:MAG: Dinitrogenase iron-molybdenum cofactor biosynthesis protein [Desulfonauticus sp. 38_4375]HCO11652.1 ATPase [Desulfonauticus sp.]